MVLMVGEVKSAHDSLAWPAFSTSIATRQTGKPAPQVQDRESPVVGLFRFETFAQIA